MLIISIVFFVLSAVLGLTVAIALLKKQTTSKPVVFAHGAVLFANDLRRKPGPLFLVVIHAVVALAAVGTVAVVALR